MLLEKNLSKLIGLFFLSYLKIVTASSVDKICGEYLFRVHLINGLNEKQRQYALFYQKDLNQKILVYKTRPGVTMDVSCEKSRTKKDLVFFRNFCGRYECQNMGYGLYDPINPSLNIRPEDGEEGEEAEDKNYKKIEKIVGIPIRYVVQGGTPFCCDLRQFNSDEFIVDDRNLLLEQALKEEESEKAEEAKDRLRYAAKQIKAGHKDDFILETLHVTADQVEQLRKTMSK